MTGAHVGSLLFFVPGMRLVGTREAARREGLGFLTGGWNQGTRRQSHMHLHLIHSRCGLISAAFGEVAGGFWQKQLISWLVGGSYNGCRMWPVCSATCLRCHGPFSRAESGLVLRTSLVFAEAVALMLFAGCASSSEHLSAFAVIDRRNEGRTRATLT